MNLEVDEEWDDKSPLWGWELGVLKRLLWQVSEILRGIKMWYAVLLYYQSPTS